MGTEARRAAVIGAGFGIVAAVVSLGVDLWLRDLGFDLEGIVASHRTNPVVWLSDLSILGLGLLGAWAGARVDLANREATALHESEERARKLKSYKAAVSLLADAVLIERRGTIEEANEAAARILAAKIEALVGQPLERFVPGLKAGSSGRQVVRCTAQGEVVAISWRYPANDAEGRPFDSEVHSSRLGEDRAIHVLRDVTDERREGERMREIHRSLVDQRDRATAQSEARRQFLAGIGHEVRTPLTSMLGYLELLEEQLQSQGIAEAVEDVRRVRSSAGQILGLIEKIHDQSMIEAGRLSLYLVPVDLAELANDVSTTIRPLLQASRSTLELDVPAGLQVRADRHRLRQILLTLLGNACQFTTEGKIRLAAETIDARPSAVQPAKDATARIAISDTGRGMAPEQVKTLFEPFQGRRPGRTGLGTAIGHELAKLMGGGLTVESEVGRGTTFTLTLPVAVDTVKVERVVRTRSGLGAHGRVLLLADDAAFRDRLAAELGARGVEAASAPSSAAALELTEALKPTGLAVDLSLLRANAWTELALLSAHPELGRLPVTALAHRGERARVVRFAGLLPLPPDRRRLQERSAVGDRQGPALVVGARSAVRALEEAGWTAREVTAEEAMAQLDEAGLLVLDLLSQDAVGLKLVLEGTALPPVIGLLPSPPTDADRTAAEAVLHAHVEKSGIGRDDAIAQLVAALAEAPPNA